MNDQPFDSDSWYAKMEIKWPEFQTLQDAMLHAIGSVANQWNFLEECMASFLVFSKIPDSVSRYLSFKLNNSQKLDVMKLLAEEFEAKDDEVHQKASIFFKFTQICAENRNFVLHAHGRPEENSMLRLKKQSRSKVNNYNTIEISIDDLRQMSQDMYLVTQFGARVEAVMMHFPDRLSQTADGRILAWPLPEAPAQPRKWDTHLPRED